MRPQIQFSAGNSASEHHVTLVPAAHTDHAVHGQLKPMSELSSRLTEGANTDAASQHAGKGKEPVRGNLQQKIIEQNERTLKEEVKVEQQTQT